MEHYIDFLTKVPIFQGISALNIHHLLTCLSPTIKEYEEKEYIFHIGDQIHQIGVIIKGNVQLTEEDYYGNSSIIAQLSDGMLFGLIFNSIGLETIPINVITEKKSTILFLDYQKLITVCSHACTAHNKLVLNILKIVAKNNMLLREKVEYLSKRTTREKILAYLNAQALKVKSNTFTIPLNRQELADYLCVDRSALSTELGKLKKEGIITFHKNKFELFK